MVSELASKGITATITPSPGSTPTTEVTVVEWDPGSRELRWGIATGKVE